MNIRSPQFIGIVTALALAVIGFFAWQYIGEESSNVPKFGWEISPHSGSSENRSSEGDGAKFSNEYSDDQFKFSLRYPDGMKTSVVEEGDGARTILVQNETAKKGFQVFVAPYDETEPLTKERILQDLPDLHMEGVQTANIDGAHAVAFVTNDPSFGRTREVWFSRGGFLYQVTSRIEFDRELAEVMGTWRFE